MFALLAIPAVARADDCDKAEILPFAGVASGPGSWRVLVDAENGQFCLGTPAAVKSLGDAIPLAVHGAGAERIVISRQMISGYLVVNRILATGEITQAELDHDQRTKLHVEGSFSLGNQVFLLAYDVAYNLPSGRRRETPREILSLFRVEIDPSGVRLSLVEEGLFKAGLESGATIAANATVATICAGATCKRLTLSAIGRLTTGREFEARHEGHALEVVELIAGPDGNVAHALAQRTLDDRVEDIPDASRPVFALCRIDQTWSCVDVAADTIPYNLRVENGEPAYDRLKSGGDPSALFLADLARSGLNGLANFGENNLEGRLTWGAAYYLNGVLSARTMAGKLGLNQKDADRLASRYRLEADLLSRLAMTSYPGFLSKRYSLDREPVSTLLNIGRILKAVHRGKEILPDAVFQRFGPMSDALKAAQGGLEEIRRQSPQAPYESHVRKYAPFWADGARLPWNYQSAWVEGLAWTGNPLDPSAAMAASMIADFLAKTDMFRRPEKWPYTSGNTLNGWDEADNISVNTPAYGGDKANLNGAHVSYRSMDAMAVLAAARTGLAPDGKYHVDHFRRLVEKGRLYPFVNEELDAIGAAAAIPFPVARLYVRSHLPWQIQSQPWALRAIAEGQ
ncbi:MAG: hypothetical protein IPL47_16745 [Phyllobacteriaceae bacterium]|nr:hypothetical protein [Phyllobacteriaceae bacterium]